MINYMINNKYNATCIHGLFNVKNSISDLTKKNRVVLFTFKIYYRLEYVSCRHFSSHQKLSGGSYSCRLMIYEEYLRSSLTAAQNPVNYGPISNDKIKVASIVKGDTLILGTHTNHFYFPLC